MIHFPDMPSRSLYICFFMTQYENMGQLYLKPILATLVVFTVLSAQISPAYSADFDIEISSTSNASLSMKKDDILTATYSFTNTSSFDFQDGHIAVYMLVHPSLTFFELMDGRDIYGCGSLNDIAEQHQVEMGLNIHPKFAMYTPYFCNLFDASTPDMYQNFAQNKTLTYDIKFKLNSPLTIGTPYIYSFHYPGQAFWDNDSRETQEVQNIFLNGFNVETLISPNKSVITFTTENSTTNNSNTTQNFAPSSPLSFSTNNKGFLENLDERVFPLANGLLSGNDLANNSDGNSGASEQTEIAQEIRDRLPQRVSDEENSSISAFLSGDYLAQLLMAVSVLLLTTVIGFHYRNRYLTQLKAQKDYSKALKIKRIKIERDADIDLKLEELAESSA